MQVGLSAFCEAQQQLQRITQVKYADALLAEVGQI
jgi:hypothetical protein